MHCKAELLKQRTLAISILFNINIQPLILNYYSIIMVKKVHEEPVEEDQNDSIVESENSKAKFLRKKPWTEAEDNLVRKLV